MASVPSPDKPTDVPVPTPVDPPVPEPADPPVPEVTDVPVEIGGPKGLEPTRYGDWEKGGIAVDF